MDVIYTFSIVNPFVERPTKIFIGREELPRKKLSPCREKFSSKKAIEEVVITKGKKDSNNEEGENRKEKYRPFTFITNDLPRPSNPSKGTNNRRTTKLMAVSKKEEDTLTMKLESPILGFLDSEKVGRIPNKIFPLV